MVYRSIKRTEEDRWFYMFVYFKSAGIVEITGELTDFLESSLPTEELLDTFIFEYELKTGKQPLNWTQLI